ncbi:MAG TPA: LysR family transcriptional regulator [Paralcaligenes sp.]|jgi:DNA-binding transcriptional LysR family regulator
MNVRQLEAFCKVMEVGSMSEAARLLGISQPAVSKSIRLLEQALKLRLFKRSGDRLYPSMEAQRLYPSARRIFDEIQTTFELGKKLQAAEVGTLKIAATYSVTAAYVTEAIEAFHNRRPLIDIQFMALPPRQIIDLVRTCEIDAGLLYEPISVPKVQTIPLCDIEMICALPLLHHLGNKDVIDSRDLTNETVISFSGEAYGGDLLKRQCEAAGASWNVAIAVNQTVVAMNMAAAGIGTAVIDSLALSDSVSGKVIIKPFRPLTVLHVSAIVPSERPLSQLCKEFIDILANVVKRHSEQSSGFHKVAASPITFSAQARLQKS